jgi:hypothetical protein
MREAQEVELNGNKIKSKEIILLRFVNEIAVVVENQDDLPRSRNEMDQAL